MFVFLYFINPPLAETQDNRYTEQLEQWFDTSSAAGRYTDTKDELIELFTRVETTEVPGELLLERLKEGAAKRVPPQRLLSVLRQDFERLERVDRVIEAAGYTHARGSTSYKQNLKLLSIVLRGGVSESVVENVLQEAHTHEKSLEVALAACDALFQVTQIGDLTDNELIQLGTTLLTSSLPSSSYSSIASLFLKGRVNRLDDSDILEIVIRVLENNGGLIQLEREIQRRTRNR